MDTFAQADQAIMAVPSQFLKLRRRIKTDTVVAYLQLNSALGVMKHNPDLPGMSVIQGVVNRFLSSAKECQFLRGLQRIRLPFDNQRQRWMFLAQRFKRRDQSQFIEHGGPQIGDHLS